MEMFLEILFYSLLVIDLIILVIGFRLDATYKKKMANKQPVRDKHIDWLLGMDE